MCTHTTNGKEYLKVDFDIAEGEYADFYSKKYDRDNREKPKWGGVWNIFIEGYNPGTTNSKFKGFIVAVEESNIGFKFDFNEQTLIGKKVGIVFREEEFMGQNGQLHTSSKPFFAAPYDVVESAAVPKPLKMQIGENTYGDIPTFEVSEDDDLPF